MLKYQDYIGDGVYVGFDGYQIWLGLRPGAKLIALEPSTFRSLISYQENLDARIAEEHDLDRE